VYEQAQAAKKVCAKSLDRETVILEGSDSALCAVEDMALETRFDPGADIVLAVIDEQHVFRRMADARDGQLVEAGIGFDHLLGARDHDRVKRGDLGIGLFDMRPFLGRQIG
jgi:hypothetical protein